MELGTFPIPMHVESETRGVFIELTQEIARRSRADVAIRVVPPRRALDGFENQSFVGMFPALDVSFPAGQAFIRTREAIDCKEDFVFTRKDTPFLKTLADLKGKRVGITRGYPYAREVTDNTTFTLETAASDEANIQKLLAGRLDAFVLDEKTGVQAFALLGAKALMQYPAGAPVSRQEVYYAFQSTAEGKLLAELFSTALQQMKADGRYQQISRGVTFAHGCPR
jgi:polar amino acid transport system substrate-binding protein